MSVIQVYSRLVIKKVPDGINETQMPYIHVSL